MRSSTRIAALVSVAGVIAVGSVAVGFAAGDPGQRASSAIVDTASTASTPDTQHSDDDDRDDGENREPIQAMAPAVTAEQARQLALQRVPGARVTEIERESDHGTDVWEIELVRTGISYDVVVDTSTGAVHNVQVDQDGDRDHDFDHDQHHDHDD
jgi:uncharacterized membrane protein YkoI